MNSEASPSPLTALGPYQTATVLHGEHRPWGYYQVLQDEPHFKLKVLGVNPGQRLSLQWHHHRQEHWLVVAGEGEVTVGDTVKPVAAGDYIFIPQKAQHRLANTHASLLLQLVEVQLGESFDESDIVRVQDDYCRPS